MKTITFDTTVFHNKFMEDTILRELQMLDDVFDISVNRKTHKVSISTRHPTHYEGVYCLLEDLGYRPHTD